MARVKMVTRSFKTTTITATVFNTANDGTGKETFTVTGECKTSEQAMKAAKEYFENNEKIIPVKVDSFTTESNLYGVEENEFLKIAKKLEGRNNVVAE